MNLAIAALALLLVPAQEEEPKKTVPAPDPGEEKTLREKADRLKKRLPELNEKIRRAVDEERVEDARRYSLDYRETEQEIEQTEQKLRELRKKRPPRLQWYENFNLEAHGRHTWWDNELELEDGIGWGGKVAFKNFLTLEYRRWEAEEEMRNGDAEVEALLVGLTEEFSLGEEKKTAFRISGAAGWIDFDSDAPGGDEDLGLIATLRPECKYYFSRGLRINAGGDIDVLRTDFNQRHHHTRFNFSVLLSIELAF